jgi:hypothetical protein
MWNDMIDLRGNRDTALVVASAHHRRQSAGPLAAECVSLPEPPSALLPLACVAALPLGSPALLHLPSVLVAVATDHLHDAAGRRAERHRPHCHLRCVPLSHRTIVAFMPTFVSTLPAPGCERSVFVRPNRTPPVWQCRNDAVASRLHGRCCRTACTPSRGPQCRHGSSRRFRESTRGPVLVLEEPDVRRWCHVVFGVTSSVRISLSLC